MKKLVFALFTLMTVSSFAQDIKVPSSLVVMEGSYKTDGVDRNGFDIVLQGEDKAINSAWVKYLSSKYDLKLKSKGTTASGEEFNNTIWSDKQFALKSAVVKDGSGQHLRVWMMFGADVLVSSAQYSAEAANVKAVIKDFAKSYYVAIFQDQLDGQTKEVASQGKEVSGLAEDNAKNEKAIAKANAAIAKSEKKKAKYQSKIESLQEKIVSSDAAIRKSKEAIDKKKNEIEKTSGNLKKEEEKFKSVNADQDAIKAKIRAIQAL